MGDRDWILVVQESDRRWDIENVVDVEKTK
jgi:hypothetical protein